MNYIKCKMHKSASCILNAKWASKERRFCVILIRENLWNSNVGNHNNFTKKHERFIMIQFHASWFHFKPQSAHKKELQKGSSTSGVSFGCRFFDAFLCPEAVLIQQSCSLYDNCMDCTRQQIEVLLWLFLIWVNDDFEFLFHEFLCPQKIQSFIQLRNLEVGTS